MAPGRRWGEGLASMCYDPSQMHMLFILSGVGLFVLGAGQRFFLAIAGRRRTIGIDPRTVRTIMQVIVSLLVLSVALYIIVSKDYDPKDKHWAYGACGTVLGYWLKG